MTDNEIKKALECCTKSRSMADCKQMCCPASTPIACSYFLRTDDDFEGVIYVELIKDALDLINRQQAEIERLQKLLEGWKTEAYKVADEKDKLYCAAVERVKTTKAEAIKGFAERLKMANTSKLTWFNEDFDNLLEEMVGDAE